MSSVMSPYREAGTDGGAALPEGARLSMPRGSNGNDIVLHGEAVQARQAILRALKVSNGQACDVRALGDQWDALPPLEHAIPESFFVWQEKYLQEEAERASRPSAR